MEKMEIFYDVSELIKVKFIGSGLAGLARLDSLVIVEFQTGNKTLGKDSMDRLNILLYTYKKVVLIYIISFFPV